MPSVSSSSTALIQTNRHVKASIISRFIEVEEIQHKSIGNHEWLVLLNFGKNEKSYEQIEIALLDIDTALCVDETTLFMQLIDDEKVTNGIIMLNPSFETSFEPDTVWRSNNSPSQEMLIPSLRRLSNQLRVDFASNVYGAEGKRRREPTRSIYEEAAASLKLDSKGRMLKRMMKAVAKDEAGVKREPGTKRMHHTVDTEEDSQTFSAMMHAATSLAQLKTSLQTALPEKLTIETITRAHNESISAKDEAINAISATLVAKDELIKAQAALISVLQK